MTKKNKKKISLSKDWVTNQLNQLINNERKRENVLNYLEKMIIKWVWAFIDSMISFKLSFDTISNMHFLGCYQIRDLPNRDRCRRCHFRAAHNRNLALLNSCSSSSCIAFSSVDNFFSCSSLCCDYVALSVFLRFDGVCEYRWQFFSVFFFVIRTKKKKRSIIYVILFNFMHFYWICFFRSFVHSFVCVSCLADCAYHLLFGVHNFFSLSSSLFLYSPRSAHSFIQFDSFAY